MNRKTGYLIGLLLAVVLSAGSFSLFAADAPNAVADAKAQKAKANADDPVGIDVFPRRDLSTAIFDPVGAQNPAYLGVGGVRGNGFSFIPTSTYLYSDKLALTAMGITSLDDYSNLSKLSRRLSHILNESFDLYGLTPEQTSKKMMEGVKDGVSVFAGLRISPFAFSQSGVAVDITTTADFELRLPTGIFTLLFSGIAANDAIDFSNLYLDLLVASEIALSGGWDFPAPLIMQMIGLDRAAMGATGKVLLGHSYMQVAAQPNSRLVYDESINAFKADMAFKVMTAGSGAKGNGKWDDWGNPFDSGLPIVGWGPGFDFGTVFYNRNHLVSIDMRDVGVVVWSGGERMEIDYVIRKDGFEIEDIPDLFDPDKWAEPSKRYENGIIDTANGEMSISGEEVFERQVGKPMLTYLPMTLNFGYTFSYQIPNDYARIALDYVTMSALYSQENLRRSGRVDGRAKFTLGSSLGLLYGYLPVRYGITWGGPESISSVAGVGLDFRGFNIDAAYRAMGSAGLIPRQGFELGFALTTRWGGKRVSGAKPQGGRPILMPISGPYFGPPKDVVSPTAAVEPTPVVDTVQAEAVSPDTASSEAVQPEVAPIDTVPAEVVPTDTTATETVPADTVAADSIQTDTVPVAPAEVVPVPAEVTPEPAPESVPETMPPTYIPTAPLPETVPPAPAAPPSYDLNAPPAYVPSAPPETIDYGGSR